MEHQLTAASPQELPMWRRAAHAVAHRLAKGADLFYGFVPGNLYQPPRKGTRELLQAYGEMPWLRTAVRTIGHAVATTPWKVYGLKRMNQTAPGNGARFIRAPQLQRAGEVARRRMLAKHRQAGELVELEEHPLLDLLNGSNAFHPGVVTAFLSQAYLDLVGESFEWIEPNPLGLPVALWPIPPHWVRNVPSPGKAFFEIRHREIQVEVPPEQILWMQDPSPLEPYGRGSGAARSLADELDIDEFAARFMRARFFNQARPDLIVMPEAGAPPISEPEKRSMETQWHDKFSGPEGVWKPAFLSHPARVQVLAQSMADLQMIGIRQHERDTVIQVLGLPPEIIGIISNSNRATSEAAAYHMARHALVPRLETRRAYVQERIAPLFDPRLIIDYESPVEEDKDYQLRVITAVPWAFKVDELRRKAGEEELPDGQGDLHMVPFSLTPQRELGTLADEPPAAPPVVAPASPPDDDEEGEQRGAVSPAGATGGSIAPRERRITMGIIERILAALPRDAMPGAVTPVVRDVLEEFAQEMMRDVGVDIAFDVTDPRVADYLRTHGGDRIRRTVDRTTKDRLREGLAAGMEAGETTRDLVRRVREIFADLSVRRARMIADTETATASNFGAWEGMNQAGVERKEWLCVAGDTPVQGFGISHIARRVHTGPMLRLSTLGKRHVTVTPEHRVLTGRGWIAAKDLCEGDDLICYQPNVEGSTPSPWEVPDVNNVPTTIEQVFDAVYDGASKAGVVSRLPNLNGNIGEGYVEVIAIDGDLLAYLEPHCSEPVRQFLLKLTDVGLADLLGRGPAGQRLVGNQFAYSTGGDPPQKRGLAGTLRGVAEPGMAGLTLVSNRYAGLREATAQGGRGTAIREGQRIDAFTGLVPFHKVRVVAVEIGAPGTRHVYDYSTRGGWMVANGIIIHNSTRDTHTRDTHVKMDGQVRELHEDFVSPSGARGPYPGELGTSAAENVQCRCTVLPLLDDGEDEARAILEGEERRAAAWRTRDAARKPFAARMRRSIRAAARRQEAAVVAELERLAGDQP